MPGFLAALIAKLTGAGTLVKTAIATAAALTMGVAGGAVAGVVPMAGGAVAGVVPMAGGNTAEVAQPAVAQATATLDSVTDSLPPTTVADTEVEADTEESVTPPTTSTSAQASTAAAIPAVPDVTDVVPTIPELPALPSCVTDLIPTGGTLPDPAQLVSQLPTCIISVVTASLPLDAIQGIIDSVGLPIDISQCLSTVLDSVPTFIGGDLSGLSGILSDCLPTGLIPGGGSGTGSIPGLGSFFPGSGSGSGSGTGSGFGSFFPGFGSGSRSGSGSGFGSGFDFGSGSGSGSGSGTGSGFGSFFGSGS